MVCKGKSCDLAIVNQNGMPLGDFGKLMPPLTSILLKSSSNSIY